MYDNAIKQITREEANTVPHFQSEKGEFFTVDKTLVKTRLNDIFDSCIGRKIINLSFENGSIATYENGEMILKKHTDGYYCIMYNKVMVLWIITDKDGKPHNNDYSITYQNGLARIIQFNKVKISFEMP